MILKFGLDDMQSPPSQKLEVLVFALGEKEYAIDLKKVQELRSYDTVNRLRNPSGPVRGVIDLLGRNVPLLDMRIVLRLAMPPCEHFSDVIVVNIGGHVLGLVVDTIMDVATLAAHQIKPVSAIGTAFDNGALIGIGTVDGRTLTLVDIDALMSDGELAVIAELAA